MLFLIVYIISILLYINNNKDWSLVLFFAIVSNLFGYADVQQNVFGYSLQSTDIGIIYIITILGAEYISNKKRNFSIERKLIKRVLPFVLFLIIAIIIDISINNTSVESAIRTTRGWLFLSFILVMPNISSDTISRVLRIIFIVTSIQILLFLTQPLLGHSLLSGKYHRIFIYDSEEVVRYGNIPTYWLFSFWYLMYAKSNNNLLRRILITLYLFAVGLSITRSRILSIALTYTISATLFHKKLHSLGKVVLIGLLIIVLVQLIFPALEARVVEGINEVAIVFSSADDIMSIASRGNIIFRVMHFWERALYIIDDPLRTIFGMGFITESMFDKNLFSIGLKDEYGNTIQLDTADISWSILIIRYGFLGTVLLTYFIAFFVYFFFKYREITYAKIGLCYMISILLISFASSMLTAATTFIIPFLLYKITICDYARKTNYYNNYSNV
jgi:hypothetical protein